MKKCQRCGGEVPYGLTSVELLGGVYTVLCLDCQTEWEGVVFRLPEYRTLLEAKAKEKYLDLRAKAGWKVREGDVLESEKMRAMVLMSFRKESMRFVSRYPEESLPEQAESDKHYNRGYKEGYDRGKKEVVSAIRKMRDHYRSAICKDTVRRGIVARDLDRVIAEHGGMQDQQED